MKKLIDKAYDPEIFRQEGHRLIDQLTDYLTDCRNAKQMDVLPPSDPKEMLDFWIKDLNNKEFDLHEFYKTIIAQSNHIHHPRYMGHQVVPPAPVAALTELLEALLNNGMAIYEMGPAVTAIERVLMQWLANKAGMSSQADGFLTSGGSAGNLTALLAARQAMSKFNIWDEGVKDESPIAVMVSAEAHYSISRAVRIMGLGDQGIIKVPVNERLQLDVARLEETYALAKAQGRRVIALVGNACSTSTGTFDPLNEMADFALAHGLWFHVDGAHGGASVLTEKYRHLVNGIERADSLVIDFHKMMLTPALTTAVLFGNGKHSFETFAQKAEYLLADKGQNKWYDGAGRTLECTKKMMGVKVYAMLRLYGEQLFSDYITAAYDLGQLFADSIRLEKGFELAVQPDCNIICFRYIPNNFMGDINNLTALVRKKILADGRFYVVQTIVRGQTYIRVSLMNPFTTISDLKSMMDLVRKLAENTTDEA